MVLCSHHQWGKSTTKFIHDCSVQLVSSVSSHLVTELRGVRDRAPNLTPPSLIPLTNSRAMRQHRTKHLTYPTVTVKTEHPFKGICGTSSGYETKTRVVRILVIFQDRPMFSRINELLSPEPSNDMAQHRSTTKNNLNKCCPCFRFTPKTGIAIPKIGVCYCVRLTQTTRCVT